MDQNSRAVPEQVLRFAPKPKLREDEPGVNLLAMLQKAGEVSNQKYERANAPATRPVEQPQNAVPEQGLKFAPKPQPKPQPREDDPIDKAGRALIDMLHKAADDSNEKCEGATILSGRLASELRTSENRIKQLEAEVAHFRDRAAHAEEWLQRISREIDSKLLAPRGTSRSRGAGD
jgi:uracil-DNA glycosylase